MSGELLVNGKPIEYERVPVPYMREGLRLYFERGVLPGTFMTRILSNDLMGACGHADDQNRRNIWQWADWLYNYAPAGSYGSPERIKEWIKSRTVPQEVAP